MEGTIYFLIGCIVGCSLTLIQQYVIIKLKGD